MADARRQLLFDYANGLLPGAVELRFRRDYRCGNTMVEAGERVSAVILWEEYAREPAETVSFLAFDEELMEVPVDHLDVKMMFELVPVDPAGVRRPEVLMDLVVSELADE